MTNKLKRLYHKITGWLTINLEVGISPTNKTKEQWLAMGILNCDECFLWCFGIENIDTLTRWNDVRLLWNEKHREYPIYSFEDIATSILKMGKIWLKENKK